MLRRVGGLADEEGGEGIRLLAFSGQSMSQAEQLQAVFIIAGEQLRFRTVCVTYRFRTIDSRGCAIMTRLRKP